MNTSDRMPISVWLVIAAALVVVGVPSALNVGPQSGIPMPVGDMQVLVASRDREAAEALLAQARRRRGRQ